MSKNSNETKDDLLALYDGESQGDKFSRKIKEAPFMAIGFTGFLGVLAYGFYNIKSRKLPLSVYLIHMRVGAQGFVVSCCALGVTYGLIKDYVYPRFVNSKKDDE